MVVVVIYLAIIVLMIAGMWKMFTKAGQAGFLAIIPIVNAYIILKIVGRPWWWLILMLIPIVSLIVWIIAMLDLAKSFGKGVGFAVGLILLGPIFVCILGFGSAQYQGPAAA
ncbi:MAG: signal peptidase I [Leptolyngbya sp. PLA3]|nr:MAG: signal peptidase I [Cyanobacteria bacterium CYA]MCE7969127.1 signal peptidase I [Leptolyngbya sp. PL-A3]